MAKYLAEMIYFILNIFIHFYSLNSFFLKKNYYLLLIALTNKTIYKDNNVSVNRRTKKAYF